MTTPFRGVFEFVRWIPSAFVQALWSELFMMDSKQIKLLKLFFTNIYEMCVIIAPLNIFYSTMNINTLLDSVTVGIFEYLYVHTES